ncbi:MAG: VWA domain-containing protein [Anaerolineae bacterium]|jgi:hypothetical protein|nr:VWA domain-containing protein [Anaerolineae bacterium]
MRFFKTLVFGLVMILFLSNIAAQDFSPLINFILIREQRDALVLEIYFHLTSGGEINTETKVDAAEVELNNGEVVTAAVIQPESPIYIALVLDASGSMIPAAAAMRAAAVASVDSAPEQAQFAVISFNNPENILTLQGFTPDRTRTVTSINQVNPLNGAGTCLYDATVEAANLIREQPIGRRAIVVFTDGVDENSAGTGPCSQNTLQTTLGLVADPLYRVPVYTIALQGEGEDQINTDGLRSMSNATGGISVEGNQSNLSALFDRIMVILASQWLAQVEMYPNGGQQVAQLTPILENEVKGTPIDFNFVSPRDFVPPFQVFPQNITYNENTNRYQFGLNMIGSGRAEGGLQISVINSETNTAIAVPEFAGRIAVTGDAMNFEFSGESLDADNGYYIRINGLSGNGLPLTTEPQVIEFKHQPEVGAAIPVQIQISGIQPNDDNDTLSVDLIILGGDQIGELQFSIVDGATQFVVDGSELTTAGAAESVEVPAANLLPGKDYVVVVRPFDFNGAPLTEEPTLREFRTEARPIFLQIEAIAHVPGSRNVIVDLASANTETVSALQYYLQLKETGVRIVDPQVIEGVPDSIQLNTENLNTGSYIVTIVPLDANNQPLSQPLTREFVFTPPGRSLPETLGAFATNPLVLGILVSLFFIAAFLLIRQRRGQPASNVSDYLPRRTMLERNPGTNRGGSTGGNDRQNMPTAFVDPPVVNNQTAKMPSARDKTRVYAGGKGNEAAETAPQRPNAILRVEECNSKVGKKIDVNQMEFVLGRNGFGHANFNDDPTVSKTHLKLRYSAKEQAYIAEDSSANGTWLDGKRMEKGESYVLPNDRDVSIQLGETVRLVYHLRSKKSQEVHS